MPIILALQLGGEGLELLLSNPSTDPPEGFAAQDDGWASPTRLRRRLSPPRPRHRRLRRRGNVLVDLETAGSLELLGDQGEARRLLAGFALELATSAWADHLDVILVGPGLPDVPTLQRAGRVTTIDEVIGELEERAVALARELAAGSLASTFAGRSRPGATESWAPTIVLCSDLSGNARLTDGWPPWRGTEAKASPWWSPAACLAPDGRSPANPAVSPWLSGAHRGAGPGGRGGHRGDSRRPGSRGRRAPEPVGVVKGVEAHEPVDGP
ncbi:MAG: hypothetical protein ACRDHK_09990 [Actinomycetota bacterium]